MCCVAWRKGGSGKASWRRPPLSCVPEDKWDLASLQWVEWRAAAQRLHSELEKSWDVGCEFGEDRGEAKERGGGNTFSGLPYD